MKKWVHYPRRITKARKDFVKRPVFEDIKFTVTIRDNSQIKEKEFHQH